MPCTNCVAFSIECKIPAPKRKRQQARKDSDRCGPSHANPPSARHSTNHQNLDLYSDRGESNLEGRSPATATPPSSRTSSSVHGTEGMPVTTLTEEEAAKQDIDNSTYKHFMKPRFT